MDFLLALIDSIVGYVKRNPLTVIILVMLLVFAPSLFGAIFIAIGVFLLLIMAIPLFLFFRLRRVSRQAEEEARRASQDSFGQGGFGQGRGGFGGFSQQEQQSARPGEGDVKVYTTSEQPTKRVSDKVGDYVDFEEVTEEK